MMQTHTKWGLGVLCLKTPENHLEDVYIVFCELNANFELCPQASANTY